MSMTLYDKADEHDACGVGLVADISGTPSRTVVENALRISENMAHRGAENADGRTGDGAGIMVQIPHDMIVSLGIDVPERGRYGTGIVFIPKGSRSECMDVFRNIVRESGMRLIAERDVPVDSTVPGEIAGMTEPDMVQVFITGNDQNDQDVLEHDLYVLRRKVTRSMEGTEFYICSLSTRSMVYKGMLTPSQLRSYFTDLSDERFTSAIAMVHSRFSTNTMPEWKLAQPFRMLCHNGEINTIRGNRSRMRARESVMGSKWFPDIQCMYPVTEPRMSDSASLDNVAEFMTMSGKTMEHTMSMLIPESWNDSNPIPDDLKAFYEYHSILMEPWDGPAAVLFTDGVRAGGMLDRNGLRLVRYTITKDGMLIMASETGVVDIPNDNISEKGRLRPGKMLVVDTANGNIIRDDVIKNGLASAYPYREWLEKNRVELDSVRSGRRVSREVPDVDTMSAVFGHSKDDMGSMWKMAIDAREPIGSMGDDTPLAVLSDRPQSLFDHFRQSFAQVTNPPIDPIREELVMSLTGYVGSIHWNILDPMPDHCKVVKLKHPILTNREIEIIRNLSYRGFRTYEVDITFPLSDNSVVMERAIERICKEAEDAVDSGASYIVLSDRSTSADSVPIPSLLAVSAVHNHLLERRKRIQTALIVESGEPWSTAHLSMLLGFGANAVNPYMVFAMLHNTSSERGMDTDTAESNYIKASEKGILKVMSKMGIATLRSYRGAGLFEAVGLSEEVINRYFPNTVSSISGIGMNDIFNDAMRRHGNAFSGTTENERKEHSWNAASVKALQKAVRGDPEAFAQFVRIQQERTFFIRDVMDIRTSSPIPLDQVESAESIMRRFSTGAMSLGSISREAHETMAAAMNSIGGRSNTGEGGEDIRRTGTITESSIKQIASGRFGVTAEYLADADEIQIKIAQGAKPGEGGQLMGSKVNVEIARTRNTLPGITLISPPPHHDIYSIEDLAQLIFDMRCVNPNARISVKLVSASGVGTIAAGVAKAGADVILISGADGGTGASPVSSIRYTGMPWEIGLAGVQQTLMLNGLRDKVILQADGQMKTGRDVIIAALLGAEEFSFSTAPLVAMGCIMDRRCHTNECPVGIATQDPERRKRFKGTPEHVTNYFKLVAEDVRSILAEMGFTSISDIVGRADLISKRTMTGKASKVDISKLIVKVQEAKVRDTERKDPTADVLDRRIMKDISVSADLRYRIRNTDRSVCTMLSGAVARKDIDINEGIKIEFEGSAGQSLGAFMVNGIDITLIGEANDYLGKGLSGGRISLIPPEGIEGTIAGNTILYGATSGEVYIRGSVGERFCVRNSGATAVAEGIGDHGCEYMTGGRVVILGTTGRNFAAGMSGGVAYVMNVNDFDRHCNMDMVELSPVENDADKEELRTILEAHAHYTGSTKAMEILNDQNGHEMFLKVTPLK